MVPAGGLSACKRSAPALAPVKVQPNRLRLAPVCSAHPAERAAAPSVGRRTLAMGTAGLLLAAGSVEKGPALADEYDDEQLALLAEARGLPPIVRPAPRQRPPCAAARAVRPRLSPLSLALCAAAPTEAYQCLKPSRRAPPCPPPRPEREGSRSLSPGSSPPCQPQGAMAPAFDLATNSGSGRVVLESFRGSWAVVYFYPKDFTGGCSIEAAKFQSDLGKFKAAGAAVLGVSVDSVDSHR